MGIKTEWFPVVDNSIPKDSEKYKELVKKVVNEYLEKGLKVVVHCKGGLGRAGTFAAACLIAKKVQPE